MILDINSLVIGALLGGIPSWFISRYFSKESSKELIANLKRQDARSLTKNSFNGFETLLRTSAWTKEETDHSERWVCDKDNTFQFIRVDDDRDFKEKWTEVFPAQDARLFHIELKINESIIKSLPFICADGGRYTLPLPDRAVIDGEVNFFWSPSNVEYKIAEIIGNFYRSGSLKEVAAFTKIDLHAIRNHA
ncbi:MAG: hypothetical protein ACI8Q1_003781 [Parvicella sp.]